MNHLAVGVSHAVAITKDGSLTVWGEDQDEHFSGLPSPSKDRRDSFNTRKVPLVWENVIYKPKTVSTYGPVTAVVASVQAANGDSKPEDIRKILLLLQEEFQKRASKSYTQLLKDLSVAVDLKLSKAPQVSPTPEPIKIEAEETVEQRQEGPVTQIETEYEDEGCVENAELQKILTGYFGLELREADAFIYEIGKMAAKRVHSKVSIRTIKDCINNARLDDGRLFLFLSTKHTPFKLSTKEISESSSALKMHVLYCPDTYRPIEAVACGGSHLLILTIDGALYSCGDPSQGALGLGLIERPVTVPMPVVIKKLNGVRKVRTIAAGREHSMCLTENNEVFTWGAGIKGKLGHGDEADQTVPKELKFINQFNPIFIAAGDSHSACITAGRKLYTWGDGQYGKLGHGKTDPEFSPIKVARLENEGIIAVSCGAFHTLALDKNYTVWSFGQSTGGKLGRPEDSRAGAELPLPIKDTDMVPSAIMAGVWNSYAVDSEGKVYSWGSLEGKMLGHKAEKGTQHVPQPVAELRLSQPKGIWSGAKKEAWYSSKISQVICSFNNSFAVTDAGEVYVFGSNENGQYGVKEKGGAKGKSKFFKIPKFTPETGLQVSVLACGFSHVLAVTTQQKLFAWGANECGQLGNGQKDPVFEPTLVDYFKDTATKFCACGDDYSAVINESGELFTFGSYAKGRLGIGPVDEQGCERTPHKVTAAKFPHIKYVCCGVTHVLAIPDYDLEEVGADRGVWSWGLSTKGQLGHGNKKTVYSPQLVQKLSKETIKKVCCGFAHSLALTEAGKVYYWGAGNYYLRSTYSVDEDKLEPVLMKASSTDKIADISANHMYNLAISSDKELFYWGEFLAQSAEEKPSMGTVIETKLRIKASQISAGPNHAAAIGTGDYLYTWGYDSEGSLGHNLSREKYLPGPKKVWELKEAIDRLALAVQPNISMADKAEDHAKPVNEVEVKLEVVTDRDKEDEKKVKGKKEKGLTVAVAKAAELPKTATDIMINKALKDGEKWVSQDKLINLQRDVETTLNEVLGMFKEIVKVAEQRKKWVQRLIINLISWLEKGPFGTRRKLHVLVGENKAVKENKASLVEIFKGLYLHPCYLHDMIRRKLIDTTFAGNMITSLYAYNADKRYTRVLMMNLGILIFRHEFSKLREQDMKGETAGKGLVLFKKVFDLIFVNDTTCTKYAAGVAGICFNSMYRTIMQHLQADAANCFAVMSTKAISKEKSKTIETALKSRCDNLKAIIVEVKERLKKGTIDADKQAGSMFIGDVKYELSEVVKNLFGNCESIVTEVYKQARSGEDAGGAKEAGGSANLVISSILLPLVFEHICKVLESADLLLLYNPWDKNKKEILEEEVRRHERNAQVLAGVLRCHVYGKTARNFLMWWDIGSIIPRIVSDLSNYKPILEFNKDLKDTEDELFDIFKKMSGRSSESTFVQSYFVNSCNFQPTIVAFSSGQIKTLMGVLEANSHTLALMRPIDKDPIYKGTQMINPAVVENMKVSDKPINFRLKTQTLQEDQSLLICDHCGTFVTQSTSSPYCKKFVHEVQRLDSLSPTFLYQSILSNASEALVTDSAGSIEVRLFFHTCSEKTPRQTMYMLAKKRGEYDVAEYCKAFVDLAKNASKSPDKEAKEMRKAVIEKFNTRIKDEISLNNKHTYVYDLRKRVEGKKTNEEIRQRSHYLDLSRNLQCGVANSEVNVPGQGPPQVKKAVDYMESLVISPELFEHLDLTKKKELKPFVKKTVASWTSKGVIRDLVYQEGKSRMFGSVESEIEAKLYTGTLPVDVIYKYFKLAHKEGLNEKAQSMILGKTGKDVIRFGMEGFMKYYAEMEQQAVVYSHRTKGQNTRPGETKLKETHH